MKPIKVELDELEQNLIFNKLIEKFNPDIEGFQIIDCEPVTKDFSVHSELELSFERSEPDENNQSSIIAVYMPKFEWCLMVDGEEMDYVFPDVVYKNEIFNRFQRKSAKCMNERIEDHYTKH